MNVRSMVAVAAVAVAATGLAAPRPYQPPFGPWTRLNGGNPILEPQRSGIEVSGVFNPAVVKHEGRYVMLYRAQDAQKTSRIGRATSGDGIRFERDPEPALVPEAEYERAGGVEDPRLVKIGETFYLTYTAYDGKDAQLALATSTDLRRWQRKGVIMPANRGRWNVHWTKSGAILDEKVNGKYWMYYMADPGGRLRSDRRRLVRGPACTGRKPSTRPSWRAERAASTRGWSSPGRRPCSRRKGSC